MEYMMAIWLNLILQYLRKSKMDNGWGLKLKAREKVEKL